MIAKRGLVYSMLCVLLLSAFLGVSQPADAASGSITIAPGETKYLSFGMCAVGDALLWDLEISTLSTIFEYWLQAPSGAHTSLYSLTWGKIADAPGEWKLGFSIDSSGWWSATVYYTIYRTTPHVEITSPLDSSYVNQASITVSGTVDTFASEVEVSLDHVHYEDADLYLGNWNWPVTLPGDGEYTIYAEGTIIWGGVFSVKYYDEVLVTLDTVLPEVGITAPADDSYIAGTLDLAWQCSDESGIALTEVKIDLLDWNTVTGSEYRCDVSDGTHTVKVRVTDLAGNTAVVNVSVISDTVIPQVAITSPVNNSYLAGELELTWQCSDECGITLREVKLDQLDWTTVDGSDYYCELSDGSHTFTVRVTDLAGNSAVASTTILSDTVDPQVTVNAPSADSKIDRDAILVTWIGSDALSGIDHYEVRISGGDWIDVGTDTTYTFMGLEDKWYSVTVRAVDKSGNSEESSVSFGIYTSIWSTNGPYDGIPLFALIAAVIIATVLSVLLLRRKRGGEAVNPEPQSEPLQDRSSTRVRKLK
jgi:hypothetical protein